MPRQLIQPILMVVALVVAPLAAAAQSPFSPAIRVNEKVVTGYELQQRVRMLDVLNAPGNLPEVARQQLIDDRLRLQAAEEAGIVASEEDVLDGMTEFAGRANLTREEFTAELARAGVAEQTFRDFVRAGVVWRQLVQARFRPRATVSEAEIDRALAGRGDQSNVRVLVSELIMPIPPGQEAEVRARAERISQITSESAFSAEARRYSATGSRGAGGRLPWQNLSDLPPPLQPRILALGPGEVTDPLPIPGAIALFQLRAIEEAGYAAPEIAAIDYATLFLPGGRSPEALARARVIAAETDRCDDLYGIAKGLPEETLQRTTLPPAQIPADIAMELTKLDPGEVSTALTRGDALMLLMLCGRTNAVSEDVAREDFVLGLRNQRLNALAESYLAELRADARIIE